MSFLEPTLRYSPRGFAGSVFDRHYMAPNVDWVEYDPDAFRLLVGAATELFFADPNSYINRDLDDTTPHPIRFNYDQQQELPSFGKRWTAALVGEYLKPEFVWPQYGKLGEYALKESVVVSEHTEEGKPKPLVWVFGQLKASRFKVERPQLITSKRLATREKAKHAADLAFNALLMHEAVKMENELVPQ